MKKLLFIGSILALGLAATAAQAAPEKYTYDPLHTQILFSVNHMGFTMSYGRFNKFDGAFLLDEQNPESSSADITIDANSIDMADNTWDEHVKEKFLETAKFPAITFKSTKIKRTGENAALMTGDLTLHGVTKPVTLNVTLNKVGMNPMIETRKDAGFSIKGSIKRSDFGITNFIPLVGDDLALDIQVDGVRQDFSKTNK
ncbi:MAG: YceI family protein [Alphaproteobacteria bacterium]|nr:YceI family protein [Alphaproteobacteria bacterium]